MKLTRNKANNYVSANLVGGLGNQLFIYSAARNLAQLRKAELRLDTSQIGVGGTNHGSNLSETGLAGYFIKKRIKIPKNLMRLKMRVLRLVGFFQLPKWFNKKEYFSTVLGFDPKIYDLNLPVILNGYFQSWRYVDPIIIEINEELVLKNYSKWFTKTQAKMRESLPVVLHVRRGDYLNLIEDFGILGLSYYETALKLVDQRMGKSTEPIWVFSDDISRARELLSSIDNRKFHFVDPPKNVHALESLILMKNARAHIIANSTFSWWAAKLSETSMIVVAPRKWFRKHDEPNDLIPLHWERVDSQWDVGLNT